MLEALRQLPQLGSRGSALLGFCHEFGIGVSVDYPKAIEYYLKAGNDGEILAQARLACIGNKRYPGAQLVEIDWKYWKKTLNAENPAGKLVECLLKYKESAIVQFCLGNCYLIGLGTKNDHKEAIYWYRQAANQGFASAQFSLGNCFLFGLGTEKEPKASIHWYSLAASQGDSSAQFELGYLYKMGIGTSVDLEAAARWYHLAALQNHSSAQLNYGNMLFEGKGVQKNEAQAVEWFHKADLQNNVVSWYRLGICYWDGSGVAKDPEKSGFWMMKAASKYYSKAHIALAEYYFYEDDFDRAVYWIEKANDPESVTTHQILSGAYYFGKGKEQDYSKAFHWYKIGAEKGDPVATYGLACCYQNGHGVERDFGTSLKFYKKAAALNYQSAQYRAAIMLEKGAGCEMNLAEAAKYYELAAKIRAYRSPGETGLFLSDRLGHESGSSKGHLLVPESCASWKCFRIQGFAKIEIRNAWNLEKIIISRSIKLAVTNFSIQS